MIEKLKMEDFTSDKPIDFEKLEAECYVDLNKSIEQPEILISIGEHRYADKYYPTPVMTAGEFSSIIATSKSKKSFLKSAFIACYIGGESNTFFLNIKSHRSADEMILDFDTEQGKFYTQRTFNRVHRMVGSRYKYYKAYATRHLNSKERLLLIDYCIRNQKQLYEKPIKLVAIDGIADLVDNTNDLVMSREASDYLQKWTHEFNIHIITVIHKSGITGKPLGHLGTYVLKKAESVIELDTQPDMTVKVTNPYSKGYRFNDFNFDVNNNGLPYLIDQNSLL